MVKGAAALGTLSYQGPAPAGGWQLQKARLYYNYSAKGIIQSIVTQSNTQLLTFAYGTIVSQAVRVTNTAGQHVDFTWSGNYVSKVTDPVGNVWNYAYNASGLLISVTSPGAAPDIRTYLYENAADATLLTGISINGTRYSTYKYYADKRVQESGLAVGEERDTFGYGERTRPR